MSPSLTITKQQQKGYNKSIRQAQSGAFLCQLVYFTIKICTILIFYNFKNILWERYELLGWFVFLLIVNTYLMLMTGKNPGYEMRRVNKQQWEILLKEDRLKNPRNINNEQKSQSLQTKAIEQQQLSLCENDQQQQEQQSINYQQQQQTQQHLGFNKSNQIVSPQESLKDEIQQQSLSSSYQNDNTILIENYCKFCQCIKRNRMKHCYSCGKCVMKHDHHCPWIGACVGELNHFMFVMCLFAHTCQAVTTLYIILKSLHFYQYYNPQTDTFSTEYGVYMLWSIFIVLYILFAGGLFVFHFYLILANVTTRELASRKKCAYLKNIKGNPYDKGFIQNIKSAIFTLQNGRQWIVDEKVFQDRQKSTKSRWGKLFSNEYYDCC